MGEFRIGMGGANARAQHVYPDNPRAAALSLFARNFATGPKTDPAVASGGTLIPWNAIDSTAKSFFVTAGDVTVSIPGDVTSLFSNGDNVTLLPVTPDVLPPVSKSIASVPAFADGVTTFDLNSAIDGSTTGGAIENNSTPLTGVPITPRATRVVRISGVVVLSNGSGDPIDPVAVQVQVDGVALPVPVDAHFGPLEDGASVTIPFLAEAFLPLAITSNIQVLVTGENATIVADSSAIDVQEVSVATG